MPTVVPIFLLVSCCHTFLCPCATTQTMAANVVNPNQHFSSIFLLVSCCHTFLCPCATTQTMAANVVNPNQHFSSNPTRRATSPLQKSLNMEAEILCEPCIPCVVFSSYSCSCMHSQIHKNLDRKRPITKQSRFWEGQ